MNEKLLNKTSYYVIGVSGGCDSMYLLDTLRKKGYHLLVAHVNYNYRHDSYIDYDGL
ncbi:MAG: ATP-binding protein [Thomasclavelia spiroformis]